MSVNAIPGLGPALANTGAANRTAPATPGIAGAGQASAAASPTNALLAPNQFLALLVDSLKYQDPLNPTSSANFLQQLASLSQVQTQSQMAQTDQTAAAANLIGRTVTGTDPTGAAVTGVVTGFSVTPNGPDLVVGADSVSLGTISSVSTTLPTPTLSPGAATPFGGSGAATSPA